MNKKEKEKHRKILKKLGVDVDNIKPFTQEDIRALEDAVIEAVLSDCFADDVEKGIISKEVAENHHLVKYYMDINKQIHPEKYK